MWSARPTRLKNWYLKIPWYTRATYESAFEDILKYRLFYTIIKIAESCVPGTEACSAWTQYSRITDSRTCCRWSWTSPMKAAPGPTRICTALRVVSTSWSSFVTPLKVMTGSPPLINEISYKSVYNRVDRVEWIFNLIFYLAGFYQNSIVK